MSIFITRIAYSFISDQTNLNSNYFPCYSNFYQFYRIFDTFHGIDKFYIDRFDRETIILDYVQLDPNKSRKPYISPLLLSSMHNAAIQNYKFYRTMLEAIAYDSSSFKDFFSAICVLSVDDLINIYLACFIN